MLLFSTLGASFFHTSAGKLSAQMRIYQPQVAKGLPFFGQLVVGKLAWKSQSKTMGGTDYQYPSFRKTHMETERKTHMNHGGY